MSYESPYTITPHIVQRVAEIVELVICWSVPGNYAIQRKNLGENVGENHQCS